jgi:hypothetical protein
MSEKQMQDLLALIEKTLGASWTDAVEHIRDLNTLEDIEEKLKHGDVNGAITGIEDAATAFAVDEHEAYTTAGQTAAEALDAKVDDALIRFDAKNPHATKWAEQNELDLVRDITEDQRAMLRTVHADGVAAGLNPNEVAKEMRASLGLTDAQAQIVSNYRKALEAGDFSNALGRELTDSRSDTAVAAAARDGRSLSSAQIDTMVDRYRQNWIGYRAETVARTESLRVTHQGTEELFRQAIANGDVAKADLERAWNHGHTDKNSRRGHRQMNNQKRAIGQPFDNPETGASLMFPGDPDADASETICCACCVSVRYIG